MNVTTKPKSTSCHSPPSAVSAQKTDPLPDPNRSLGNLARAADHLGIQLANGAAGPIFNVPGGTIAPVLDALIDHPGVGALTLRHENHAVFAACGHAFASGRPGLVAVTSGPGIANSINGIESAHRDDIPIIVFVGEVARDHRGRGALQDGHESDIRARLRPITRWVAEVPSASAAAPMLSHALQVASGGPGRGRPGPVALLFPRDVSDTPAPDCRTDVAVARRWRLPRPVITAVRDALRASPRAAILAGHGVRTGEGPADLRRLAERLQCPVLTTPRGKGVFPESHHLSLGVASMGGHPSARDFLRRGVDTLLAVGTGLGELATDGWSSVFQPSLALIHVDIDASRIGRHYPADIAVGAPPALFLRALYRALRRIRRPESRLPGLRLDADPSDLDSDTHRIHPARAIWEIQRCLPADTIFTVDSGSHTFVANHYLRIDRPDAYLAMLGQASMGSSISAVGIKVACPDRSVAVIVGDGGFATIAPEITVCAQHGLEIAFFVFNDHRLSMVERGNRDIFSRTPDYGTGPMTIAALAAAVGARSVTVTRANQLLALDLDRLLAGGPLVVDVQIDPEASPPSHQRFESLRQVVQPTSRIACSIAGKELGA